MDRPSEVKAAATSSPKKKPTDKKPHRKGRKPPKEKMTKEERRAKYTQIARDRREKNMTRARDKYLICYRCRKQGHSAESCTVELDADGEGGEVVGDSGGGSKPAGQKKKQGLICYKCGSTEHRIQQCAKIKSFIKPGQKKIDFGKIGVLPFASCYVCNKSGHLSSYCPDSKNGVFPKGGTCNECGVPGHFAADCPNKNKKNDDDDKSVSSNSVTIEQYLDEPGEEKKEAKKSAKKRKVVQF